MSETEHVEGRLKNTGVTFDEFMIEYKKENERPDYYGDDKVWFDDVFYELKFTFKGIVYDIEKNNVNQDSDISILTKDGDNFDFEFKFYNGGTCLSEMIEESIDKLTKESK